MTPALRKALTRFLFDDGQPVMVDGTGIVPDPDLAARNAARIEAAKQQLGSKWLCWNDRDAENDEQERAAHSHSE